MSELQELLRVALRAADIARDVIMPLYESGTSVELKTDHTPVTAADRGGEEAIRAFLQRECPAHGVLGEEFGETPGDGRHRWILDPIDGTKSFIRHVPLFGTLIALERDGTPVVGVIACHAAGETAYAAQGGGAFLNGRPIHVSAAATLASATISLPTYARLWRESPAAFSALANSGASIGAWGDCYGYLMVAAGRCEAMLDPEMNLWDVAALYPVITEAGGQLTTWDGSAAIGASAVATNGLIHDQVLRALRAAG